jgi:hypothetical protein
VRAFLGLAGYDRRFIKDFGTIASPLTKLVHKEGFRWSEEAVAAFDALQRALMTASVLQLPDFDQDFIAECDASGVEAQCFTRAVGRWRSLAGISRLSTPNWAPMNGS